MAVFETLLQGAKSKQIDMKAISRSRDVQQIGLQRQAKQRMFSGQALTSSIKVADKLIVCSQSNVELAS